MGLEPLEFSDCLTDSPVFRSKLHDHEKELERTSKAIKTLISDGKELLNASRSLAKAQKTFSQNLIDFKFECIGQQQTDDEIIISGALKEFGKLLSRIEDERERMLEKANDQFIKPLENFRKNHIGSAKEGKKLFDKSTTKFCASLDRYLSLKTKVPENIFKEADATLDLERRDFYQSSMRYVLKLQEVQERKKFEFVEILLVFMYGMLTFHHEGHETAADAKDYLQDLQHRLQKTRESFETTREQAENLLLKMLEVRGAKPLEKPGTLRGGCARMGYLYLLEKKPLQTTWSKHWCWYNREGKQFYMVPFNQTVGKVNQVGETLTLKSCVRRASDSIDRRFCIDITVEDKSQVLTFQALSEEDRKLWMDVMDGKEPVYSLPKANTDDSSLDDVGFNFIKRCICAIEERGLEDQGLYRVVGVNSKVNKLIQMGLDRKKADKVALEDPSQYEIKTITSAVKTYLRSLPEPLMTYKLHPDFIAAAKQEAKTLRLHDIHTLVHKLPPANFDMLDLIIAHLRRVSRCADKNLMTVANLGVCFGPTLMRPEEESVAAIMDIKFCNIVIELLVNNYDMIFKEAPEDADLRSNVIKNYEQQAKMKHAPGPPVNHLPKPIVTATAMSTSSTVGNQSPRQYANLAPGLPHQQQINRNKVRAVDIYNPSTGGFETQTGSNSASDSSDSLNSSQSNHVTSSSTPSMQDQTKRGYGGGVPRGPGQAPVYSNINVSELANRLILSTSDVPTLSTSMQGTPSSSRMSSVSMTGSVSGSLGNLSSNHTASKRRTVRTLFRCEAENETELSFEPNQIIKNVRLSKEPGWLEGSIDGKTGLIPENYVEYID